MVGVGPSQSGDFALKSGWFGGGGCSVNIADKTGDHPYQGVVITNNVFSRGSTKVKDCAIVANPATKKVWTQYGNRFDDGTAARIY